MASTSTIQPHGHRASLMVWFHSRSLWKPCQGLHGERWRWIEIALPVVKQNCRLSTPLKSVPSLCPRVWIWVGWADKGNSILSASSTETDSRLEPQTQRTESTGKTATHATIPTIFFYFWGDEDDNGSSEKTEFQYFLCPFHEFHSLY